MPIALVPAPLDMTVSFVTNRNVSDHESTFGEYFNALNPSELRFGLAEVNAGTQTFSSTKAVMDYCRSAPWRLEIFPDALSEADVPGSQRLFERLHGHMKVKERDTLIYVHGFATTFAEALSTGFAIQWFLRTQAAATNTRPVNVTVFSWPSNGRLLEYFSDRDDAANSGAAFARAFTKLKAFLNRLTPEEACVRGIHLLAHSMGNFVLERALPSVRYRDQGARLPQVFDEVLMAAPDVDVDAFEHSHKLARLPELARRVTVYVNRRDKALWTSDKTKGNPDRLGRDGPLHRGRVADKVELVDLTGDVSAGPVNHNYQVDHRFLADVANTIAGRLPSRYEPAGRTWRADDGRWVLP